jgi:hypothetical protein
MAGPARVPAALPVRTKMPVPMITPTPNTVRSRGPSVLRSLRPGSSVSAIDCSTVLLRSTLIDALPSLTSRCPSLARGLVTRSGLSAGPDL